MQEVKPVKLFPTLYNREAFIFQDHPEYHPDTTEYTEYWEEHEKRCLEGFWGLDSNGTEGGWRYMPGNLYYYINLCKIILEHDLATKKIEPLLRDVEWLLSYGWLTARSFSGFSEDTEHTCHRMIGKLELGEEELTPKELRLLEKYSDQVKKPDGTYKKYVEAREYLYKTHDKPLGKPIFQNDALNFFVLGSRGFGKSFFCANAVIGHEFNFYGKRAFNAEYLNNPSSVEIFVGSAIANKSQDLLSKFELTQEYLKKGPGSYGNEESFSPGYFFNNTTGTLVPSAKKPYKHEYQEKVNGIWVTRGTGTVIKHGVYTTENPQAAVGTRPSVMVIEEVGLLSNVLTVQGANETCQIRDNKFGSSFYIGTGGNMDKIIESQIIFEDPEAYKFVPYKDEWEGRPKPIGFFLPSYYVDNSFKDENGNTDLEASFAQEMYEREVREKAKTSNALNEYIMSRPIFPSEMFLSAKNKYFPVALLKKRLQYLLNNPVASTTGTFKYTKDKQNVIWEPDASLKSIDELVIPDSVSLEGAIKIYEHPPDHGRRFSLKRPFFKITYDPVKDDHWGTSLASILVYKGYVSDDWESEKYSKQNTIVAEYIGRFERVEQIHEIAIQLALYYGARIMVENNLPDFIRYCRLKKVSYILQPSPWEAISKIIKNPSRKYDVGVTMNKTLNVQCEHLINDILHEEDTIEGELKEGLFKIPSIRLLQELIHYHREGNYDHVSAYKLLALWIKNEEEYSTSEQNETEHYLNKWQDSYSNMINASTFTNPFYDY